MKRNATDILSSAGKTALTASASYAIAELQAGRSLNIERLLLVGLCAAIGGATYKAGSHARQAQAERRSISTQARDSDSAPVINP